MCEIELNERGSGIETLDFFWFEKVLGWSQGYLRSGERETQTETETETEAETQQFLEVQSEGEVRESSLRK